jgi:predicted glycoside hydrolase/deacetylase ChbG (UPF0249 family)
MATICICIDDFGWHEGVNQAAFHLIEQQRVHALSCQVGGPAWRAPWLQRLRAVRGVDIGLHLDFTAAPLLPGSIHGLARLILAAGCRQLRPAALRAEIRAQLDAFERDLGRAPDFVDGHQHVHQLPQIRDELLAELSRRYPGNSAADEVRAPPSRRPWLRATRAMTLASQPLSARIKPRIIETLGGAGLAAAARRLGFAQNQRLLGVYDFHGDAQHYRTLLQAWLTAAADGDLLMCHPAARIDTPSGDSPAMDTARRQEFEVLAGDGFTALLDNYGIRLTPLSASLAQGPGQT